MRHYDPTERRNKWRWDLAALINRMPGTCWANLVSWALGSRPMLDLRNGDDVRQDWMCASDAARNGRCYCGKREAS